MFCENMPLSSLTLMGCANAYKATPYFSRNSSAIFIPPTPVRLKRSVMYTQICEILFGFLLALCFFTKSNILLNSFRSSVLALSYVPPKRSNIIFPVRLGLDIGDMNKKLLQKIEELTLYLIDQQKQLKSQQEQINLLQKQNETYTKPAKGKR